MTYRLWLATVAMVVGGATQAAVQPHALFTDGCVLQRDVRVPIWGKAKTGEKVTVEFRGQKIAATADLNSRWMVHLKRMNAGGPFPMTIRGENTITLTNVYVGEVWVCSGQSNMEWPLRATDNAAQAIAAADDPMLRLFYVPKATNDLPQYSVAGAWQACTPQSVGRFSAVAYYFGRDLRRQLGVPVGLLDTAYGGSYAEAWTDRATLEKVLPQAFERYAQSLKNYDPEKAKERFQELLEKHKAVVAKAQTAGKRPPPAPHMPRDPRTTQNRPTVLYNAMLAPLQPYALRGAIWYQGEGNAIRAKEYQALFPAMIGAWRKAWGLGDFPFLFVQIAPFQGQPPEIREAQLISWHKTKNTAMTVITDHGNATNIHPEAKEPVGGRLALAARALAYGEKIEYSGPVFQKMTVKGDQAILSFTHRGGGLVAKGGALKGFTVAAVGSTNFVPATAAIVGDTVVVSSAQVPQPAAVRYGWANVPDVNLFNKVGLPATPFRTDGM
jgi:sialate O-acetylesterase